jgi:hypothetical protein
MIRRRGGICRRIPSGWSMGRVFMGMSGNRHYEISTLKVWNGYTWDHSLTSIARTGRWTRPTNYPVVIVGLVFVLMRKLCIIWTFETIGTITQPVK